jgi:hypothetical protein
VSHRIASMSGPPTNPTVVTKGDANGAVDAWKATLQGTTAWRVRGTVPGAGYVLHAVRGTTLQRLSFVCLGLFALLALWRVWQPATPEGDAAELDEFDDDILDDHLTGDGLLDDGLLGDDARTQWHDAEEVA